MKENLSKKFWKFAIPLAIVWGVIVIAKSGYAFGQWLFAMMH